MVNTTKKGNRNQLAARKILENAGYLVESKPRTKYHSPDFYGLFDLLAIKGKYIRLIQVKSQLSHFYTGRKNIKEWLALHKPSVICEVWVKENKKPWRREIVK